MMATFRVFTVLATVLPTATACSNMLVGAKASGTGSPQIAYTSDAGFQVSYIPISKCPAI